MADEDPFAAHLAEVAPASDDPFAEHLATVEAKPGVGERFVGRIKNAVQHPLDELKATGRDIANAAGTAGTLASNAVDTATFGLYRRARDAIEGHFFPAEAAALQKRENEENAAHPLLSQASNAVGYLAPGTGPARLAEAASAGVRAGAKVLPQLAARVLTSRPVSGAITGAATNAGTTLAEGAISGAPLSETLPAAGRAALTGAEFGGALGTLGAARAAVAEGAGGRAAKRLVQTLTAGAGESAPVKKLRESPHEVAAVAHEFGLDEVAHDPKATIAATRPVRAEIGQRLSQTYAAADQLTKGTFTPGGMPLSDLVKTMQGVKAEYAGPGVANKAIRATIDAEIETVKNEWGTLPKGATSKQIKVPSNKVREYVTSLQEGAFASPEVSPKAATRASRRLATSLRNQLNGYIEEASKIAPDDLEIEMSQLPELNRQHTILKRIEEAAEARALAPPPESHALPEAHELHVALHNPVLGAAMYGARRAGGLNALLGALDRELAGPAMPVGLGNRISAGLAAAATSRSKE